MNAGRMVILLLLILAILVSYHPGVREQALKAWETLGPAVAGITHSLYAAIQDLLESNASGDRLEEHPVPAPGTDFQRIVTRNISSGL